MLPGTLARPGPPRYHRVPVRRLVIGLLAVVVAGRARAACAPDVTVHVVYRYVAGEGQQDVFGARPRTVYRLGSRYGRLEEEPDVERKIHALFVVAMPDAWMVNLLRKEGRHIVDPDPAGAFRAPVFGGSEKAFFDLELGCEKAFFEALGLPGEEAIVAGKAVRRLEIERDGTRATFVFERSTDRPLQAFLRRRNALIVTVTYDVYERIFKPDMRLYEKPAGIAYTESKTEP